MKQRKQGGKRVKYRQAAMAISSLFAVSLFIFGSIQANAKPAALVSPSAVVYETTDENSNAVGNLVQGNTFELKETITLESGMIWHSISMSNGAQGYVRGEVSTEIESSAAEEESSNEEETSEETSSEEESSVTQELEISENTKKKTYSIQPDVSRMREPTEQTQVSDTEKELQQTKRVSVDKTLILLICVTLLSAVFVYFSYTKIKLISSMSQKYFYNPKSKKRKKARRLKKKRTVKEANKWKRNNLQN